MKPPARPVQHGLEARTATVRADSPVMRDIPAQATVFSVPARQEPAES